MIQSEDIYNATDGGKTVILHYYPQAEAGFERRRNFRLREDDREPSCTVYRARGGNCWLLQDKGGSDTNAYNAITLVQREEGLTYPEAIDWIAAKFAPQLLVAEGRKVETAPAPIKEPAAPVDEMAVYVRPDGQFTKEELKLLGYNITQEICDDLCLKPLDSYVTAQNNGRSTRIAHTDRYPMYYYDYGAYGRIYQPLGQMRFMWKSKRDEENKYNAAIAAWREKEAEWESAVRAHEKGKGPAPDPDKKPKAKPEPVVLDFDGDREFRERFHKAILGQWTGKQKILDEDGTEQEINLAWDKLIICSGGSDALNVHGAGYHVCWPNSESMTITETHVRILTSLAKKVYILYDIDETGKREAMKLAMRYLDLNLIILPESLRAQGRGRNGKPYKDAKDFFTHYKKDGAALFNDLVKISGSLKFWTAKWSKQANTYRYDINNEQMYRFLEAAGFFTIETTATREGFTFCRIQDNVVRLIDKEMISAECAGYLVQYLYEHPEYYSPDLVNAIHRTAQISPASLAKLRRIAPDFDAFTEDFDWLWFRNGIYRIGADGIVKVAPQECPYYVYDSKIIQHDLRVLEPFFEIQRTPEYQELLTSQQRCAPSSPQYFSVENKIDTLDDVEKFRLVLRSWGSTYMQYLWNTCRTYWRDELAGSILTEEQQDEYKLNFMAKCMAIGYMLCKYKRDSEAYAVYAMETELVDDGISNGGTGKSLFMSSLRNIRKMEYIDGRRMQEEKMEFAFQGVTKGITDIVFMDDMSNRVRLDNFLNMVTGPMEIKQKHAKGFVLEAYESPKLCFTSNFAIKGFNTSLGRRIWFAAFSDYYHGDDIRSGMKRRSPKTDFGKDLIRDYTPEEMNAFYNFMLTCMVMWHRLKVRIQPPMKKIIQRTLVKAMTDEFFNWAEEWFTPERLNTYVKQDDARDAYMNTLSRRSQDYVSWKNMRQKLADYCQFHGWTLNPPELFKNKTDREMGAIRKKEDGIVVKYFYIDTRGGDSVEPSEASSTGGSGGQVPGLSDPVDEAPF